jgi:Secretion system C-terminal sorting domain
MKKIYLTILIFFYSSNLFSQFPPPPILGQGEYWTDLWSMSYDYQGNGSVRYAAQDPSNPNAWCAIIMSQQDSTTPAGAQRYIYYSYSDDNGNTWASNVLDVTSSINGFPDISLSNGNPVIACTQGASFSNCSVFADILFGAYSFTNIFGIPSNPMCTYPKIAGTTNGNIVMTASSLSRQSYRSIYSLNWSAWQQLPSQDNSQGSYTVAAGSGGRVSIFTMDFTFNNAIKLYRSSDNGTTFDNGITIFNYYVDGNDTLYANPIGGFQAVYSNLDPNLVFAVYKMRKMIDVPHGAVFTKPKILHWSEATGMTVVASENNMPFLADTLITSSMATLCQPSITNSPSGKLTCSFTTFLRGNVQVVQDGSTVNAGEIFLSDGYNGGPNWSGPINITNTPNFEEKYSFFSSNTNTDSNRVFFLRDMMAGNWVQVPEWGKAPVYCIFSRLTPISDNQFNSSSYKLYPNFPNPFNPKTIISYSLDGNRFVSLKVFNILGDEIATLINQKQNPGSYQVEFDGSNLSSGIYFYTLLAGEFKETRRMLLVK